MPIGTFAVHSGLTASALRFYADSGVLPPAEVDQGSGYRHYRPEQLEPARLIRRLREIAMPLATVRTVLDAGPAEAARLIDEHVATVVADAAAAQRQAALVTAALADGPDRPVVTLKGPVLADAVEQVLTATAREPTMPVLGGVHVEVGPDAVLLTATDRYRLSMRTLAPLEPATATWSATVHGDDLRAAAQEARRCARVRMHANEHGIRLRPADRDALHCRLLAEQFPDHRRMLDGLPEVSTRVTLSKRLLLSALAEHPDDRIALRVTDGRVTTDPAVTPLSDAATGRDLEIWFDLTTLYPAISTAIGPDVLLDLRGPEQPVTIRSADRGDLTTLAMPVPAS